MTFRRAMYSLDQQSAQPLLPHCICPHELLSRALPASCGFVSQGCYCAGSLPVMVCADIMPDHLVTNALIFFPRPCSLTVCRPAVARCRQCTFFTCMSDLDPKSITYFPDGLHPNAPQPR